MSAETGHIGASLGAISVAAAIIGAALAGLGAQWWAWTGVALWGLLWLTAASGLSDPASRKFLAGTLRKSTFTQIYTTLARRNVMALWNRYCDPAPDNASTPTLFRAALTWRLYDLALLLAVAYLLLLLIGQWVLTGGGAMVGSLVLLPERFWPDTAAAFLIIVTFATVIAGAVVSTRNAQDRRNNPCLVRLSLTSVFIGAVLIAAATLDWAGVTDARRSLFLFLAVLPLVNALFDVLSYAVTLSLIRRGLRAALPFLWGLADLAVACVLLLGLVAVLVAVIQGLNLLAGVPLLDLPALFEGVRAEPGAYVWLYLMLFSTLLPTLLHACLSLLGVQGIWPKTLRRPVATWVEAAPASPLHAIRASLGLSLIWAVPLLLLGAGLWALWHVAEPGVVTGLGLYLDGLTWIAGGPVGAI